MPVPALIGVVEPTAANELPAIVLSLERVERLGAGLGARSELIVDGVLPWESRIDLANPFLPGEPDFPLVSGDRRQLILSHGGLVRADGTSGALGPSDLAVTVAGAARTVVTGAPTGNQVRAEPDVGRLTFGTPLPASGVIVARYHLGQWERAVVRLAGRLRLEVAASAPQPVVDLSRTAVQALQGPEARAAIAGLEALSLVELGPVARADPDPGPAQRRRHAVFAFAHEHRIDAPESSGGVILRIPITTRLELAEIDDESGAITVVSETEQDELGGP